MLDRVKEGQKLNGSSYLVREAYKPNLTPLVPSLDVKKFVVVGGGC